MSKDKKKTSSKNPASKVAPSRGLGRGLSALMNDVTITSGLTGQQDPTPTQKHSAKTPSAKKAVTPSGPTSAKGGVTTVAINQLVRNPE